MANDSKVDQETSAFGSGDLARNVAVGHAKPFWNSAKQPKVRYIAPAEPFLNCGSPVNTRGEILKVTQLCCMPVSLIYSVWLTLTNNRSRMT